MGTNNTSLFMSRKTPWSGIGTIVSEALTSAEAIKAAGLDWTVEQIPLDYKGNPSDFKMNIRSDSETIIGVVGNRYQPVQNIEAFSFIDELLGEGVTYESAGCINNGRRVWMLAKLPPTLILDEEVDPYMLVSNFHDSFGSLKAYMTPIRLACTNQLNMIAKTASRSWSVRHTGSIGGKIAEAKIALGRADKYMTQLAQEANELYTIKIAPATYVKLVENMFPITGEMSQRKEDSQLLLRDQLNTAWKMDDLGNIAGTGWGFVNAVADMATHKPPIRKTNYSQENAFLAGVDSPILLDAAAREVRALAR